MQSFVVLGVREKSQHSLSGYTFDRRLCLRRPDGSRAYRCSPVLDGSAARHKHDAGYLLGAMYLVRMYVALCGRSVTGEGGVIRRFLIRIRGGREEH